MTVPQKWSQNILNGTWWCSAIYVNPSTSMTSGRTWAKNYKPNLHVWCPYIFQKKFFVRFSVHSGWFCVLLISHWTLWKGGERSRLINRMGVWAGKWCGGSPTWWLMHRLAPNNVKTVLLSRIFWLEGLCHPSFWSLQGSNLVRLHRLSYLMLTY